MICYSLKKFKLVYVLFIYIHLLLNPLWSFESRDYLEIDMMIESCYKDINFCKEALFKINNYQKNAAINKNFSCQTRFLGLEANLIMAMNYNLRRKEGKSIIKSIKKYC